mmetsp:Transcript_69532/g.157799  ORF Transcript_69532/g.157799 Transcript_69532/m.157799 type:complete len:238 (+) Transcript_69532:191-904(+)
MSKKVAAITRPWRLHPAASSPNPLWLAMASLPAPSPLSLKSQASESSTSWVKKLDIFQPLALDLAAASNFRFFFFAPSASELELLLSLSLLELLPELFFFFLSFSFSFFFFFLSLSSFLPTLAATFAAFLASFLISFSAFATLSDSFLLETGSKPWLSSHCAREALAGLSRDCLHCRTYSSQVQSIRGRGGAAGGGVHRFLPMRSLRCAWQPPPQRALGRNGGSGLGPRGGPSAAEA